MAAADAIPRSPSRASCLTSTTYHSIQNNDLPESSTRSRATGSSTTTGSGTANTRGVTAKRSRPSRRDDVDKHPAAFEMVRQDSGYESGFSAPRSSSKRRKNTSKTSSSPSDPSRTRPGFRRNAASTPMARMPRSSLTASRPSFLTPQQQSNLNRKNSYFQFPAPENLEHEDDQTPRASVDLAPVILKVNTANLESNHPQSPDSSASKHWAWPNAPISPFAVPPPTTHYWNEHTRQLEYAAIDAASKGVRGWIMRNVVPDCFVPRSNRRVSFEDDGGSVRRYRIELEVECPEESVPPSPVGEKLRGFRLRNAKRSWWARLRGCNA